MWTPPPSDQHRQRQRQRQRHPDTTMRPWTPPESEDDDASTRNGAGGIVGVLPSPSVVDADINTTATVTPLKKERREKERERERSTADSGYFGEAGDSPDIRSTSYSREEKEKEEEDVGTSLPTTPSPSQRHQTKSSSSSATATGLGLAISPRPYTPTPSFAQKPNIPGAIPPQYPYTPDSARPSLLSNSTRTHTFPSLSSPIPWSAVSHTSPSSKLLPPTDDPLLSPVQSALFSCIANLEHLIQTSQPNDTQLEVIISQFESIASFLSAPEAQSRTGDDVLFAELENVFAEEASAGTTAKIEESSMGKAVRIGMGMGGAKEGETGVGREYVAQVDAYIKGVRGQVAALRKRFEDTRVLNAILVDVIVDLREELRVRISDETEMSTPREEGADVEEEKEEEEEDEGWRGGPPDQGIGFWGAVGEALDRVAEGWLEW